MHLIELMYVWPYLQTTSNFVLTILCDYCFKYLFCFQDIKKINKIHSYKFESINPGFFLMVNTV